MSSQQRPAREPCPECPFRRQQAHPLARQMERMQAHFGRPGGTHTCHMLKQSLSIKPSKKQLCRGHVEFKRQESEQPGGCGLYLSDAPIQSPDQETQGERFPLQV